MKGSTRSNILLLAAAVFGYSGLFHETLGLPDWTEIPLALASLVCIWTIVWLQRRARKRGDPNIVPATPAQNRRRTWLMLGVTFLSCAVSPFFLPYTGVTLPLGTLIATSALTFVICAALIVFVHRRRERS